MSRAETNETVDGGFDCSASTSKGAPGENKPSWIQDLRAAWDVEIDKMPEEKKLYFLQFPSSDEEEGVAQQEGTEAPKKNRKIRRNMKHFVEDQFLVQKEQEKRFLSRAKITNSLSNPETGSTKKLPSPPSSTSSNNSSPLNDTLSHDLSDDEDEEEAVKLKRQVVGRKQVAASLQPIVTTPNNNNNTTTFSSSSSNTPSSTPASPISITTLSHSAPTSPSPSTASSPRSPSDSSPVPSTATSFMFQKATKPKPANRQRQPSILQKIFGNAFSTNSNKSESQRAVEDLTKFLAKLNKFLDECKLVINELRFNEKNLKKSIKQEIATLQEYRLYPLIKVFRQLSMMKLVRIRMRRVLEKGCREIILERIKQTQLALDQYAMISSKSTNSDYSETVLVQPSFINDDFFKIDEVLTGNEVLARRWKRIKMLDAHASKLTQQYLQLKQATAKPKSKKEVTDLLKKVLHSKNLMSLVDPNYNATLGVTIDKYFLDSLEGTEQEEFNSVVGDSRLEEGKSIKTFMRELSHYGVEKIPSTEVVNYVQSYNSYLVKLHKVVYNNNPEQTLELLNVMTNRFIFSLIGLKFFDLERRRHEELDDQYFEQVKILKRLSPVQLGVDAKFLPDDYQAPGSKHTYHEAIHILEFLPFLTSPLDMLHCIYCCAKSIHYVAKHFCEFHGKEFGFGADEFFPILVYVVVHANLPMVHAHLSFINKFTQNNGERNSEVMYYVTCLEGAIQYSTQLSSDDIQNLTKV